MSEFKFIFGTVSSGKTLKLLSQHYHYNQVDNTKCILITPFVDSRNGRGVVKSRMVHKSTLSDIVVKKDSNILSLVANFMNLPSWKEIKDIVLVVDEIQFFELCHIDQLYKLSLQNKITCYGLKTNFKQQLWPSSAKMLALATHIESVEVPCKYCSNIAHFNLKTSSKNIKGNDILLGSDETFVQVCSNCYCERTKIKPEVFVTRSLEADDCKKGFTDLLSQLTECPPLTFEQYQFQFEKKDSHTYETIVIEDTMSNAIIATVTLLIEDKFTRGCGKVGHIEDLVVDVNYRGQSFGKQLMTRIVDIAQCQGCYKIILSCTLKNSTFYQKFGFIQKDICMSRYF